MTRVTTTILIMMVLMNGTITIMGQSGLSDDIGVELAPGVSENIDAAVDTAKDGFSADAGLGETLFALFMSGLRLFSALITAIFAVPAMFMNLGFPEWLVMPIFTPVYIIAALEFIVIATGRETL